MSEDRLLEELGELIHRCLLVSKLRSLTILLLISQMRSRVAVPDRNALAKSCRLKQSDVEHFGTVLLLTFNDMASVTVGGEKANSSRSL